MSYQANQRSHTTIGRSLFWRVLGATAVVKLLLAVVVPFTGDEAYYLTWGKFLDLGYYDHPGMGGWWLWLMLQVSDAEVVIRLPAILTPLIVAWLIRRIVAETNPEKADLVATLFLLSPANLLNFFTTTDTPVFFFGFLAGLWTWLGWRRDRTGDYFVAGLFLGAAFFAKYFAVPLGLALGAFVLIFGGKRRFAHFAALAAGVLPWAALNILWLSQNGWTNIIFNFYNRNEKADFALLGPLVFLAFIAIYLTPGITWYFLKPKLAGRSSPGRTWENMRRSGFHVFAMALAVPFALFFVVSFFKSIGFHWLLTFAPFLFLLLATAFDRELLHRMLRPTLVFSAIPIVGVFILLPLPPTLTKGLSDHSAIILSRYPDKILEALEPYRDEYVLMSPNYILASLMTFHTGQHVPVFGKGSYHARQDDFNTDFRKYDGMNIMAISNKPRAIADSKPWFEEMEVVKIDLYGADLDLILGKGFNYEKYRDGVLRKIAADHYAIPDWMQSFAKTGPFVRRYGLQEE